VGQEGASPRYLAAEPDGGNPIQARVPQGTKYSVVEKLEHGRCWKLRKLDGRDEDGVPFPLAMCFCRWWPIAWSGENQGPGRRLGDHLKTGQ